MKNPWHEIEFSDSYRKKIDEGFDKIFNWMVGIILTILVLYILLG